jgi:hypothetical protein
VATETYLDRIVQWFTEAGEAVNARLVAEGLEALTGWYVGMPVQLRQGNGGYGFFELPDHDEVDAPEVETSGALQFAVPMVVGLVLMAPEPGALLVQAARTVPHVVAAIEGCEGAEMADGSPLGYYVRCLDWAAGPRMTSQGTVRLFHLPFVVTGERALGGVS